MSERHIIKDHLVAKLVNDLAAVGKEFGQTQQLRERISHIVSEALAGAAEPVAWKEYAQHLEWCRTCAEDGVGSCHEGVQLKETAEAAPQPSPEQAALLAAVEGLRLPASYSGSQLLTSGSAVRVTFAFTDLAQAEAWHEKMTAAADAAQSATARGGEG